MASSHKTSKASMDKDKDKENQAQHAGMNSLQAAFKGSLYTQSSGSDKVLCVWLFICVEVNTVSYEGITH